MATRYEQRVAYAHRLDAASDLERDQARERREQAEAALQQARRRSRLAAAQLDLERARLATHTVAAPFAGQVIRIEGRAGATLTQSDTLLTLANLDTLRADLHVPIRWFGKLEIGHTYTLAATEPIGEHLPARLISCEPLIDAGTRTFRCVFEIDNSAGKLPAGFAVRLVAPGQLLTLSPKVPLNRLLEIPADN